MRHRNFLKQLETKKTAEREDAMLNEHIREIKENKFREQAAKQREKIKGLKATDADLNGQDVEMEFQPLTANNLAEEVERVSHAPPSQAGPRSKAASKKSKKSAKPAWAMTEKATEDAKEAEIDDLLEFAYELDYEKYMEDYEVRQALALIKERVTDLTKDQDWKQRMADEWNAADAQNAAMDRLSQPRDRDEAPRKCACPNLAGSTVSGASKASFAQRVKEAKATEERPEWNGSVTASEARNRAVEDRVA